MKTFSIKEAIKRGWEIWKQNKKLLTIAAIILLVVGNAHSFAGNDGSAGFAMVILILSIIVIVLGIIIQIGWWKMLLKLENGEGTQLSELWAHKKLFWKYLAVAILYGLISAIGFLLLIVPGIYFLIKYQFATLVLVDKNTSIRGAFDESARLTKGVKWKLLGFLIVSALINILGFIAFVIGILVAMPVASLAYVHIYRRLHQEVA